MNKHRYQAKSLQQVDWAKVARDLEGQRLVVAVDVAKEDFVAALLVEPQQALVTIKWQHPLQTRELGHRLGELPASQVEVVLEPSGTYGDSVREHLRALGFKIYLISPKRVHDAAEIYDGVPSLHDAKAAYLIARLHLEQSKEQSKGSGSTYGSDNMSLAFNGRRRTTGAALPLH